jgi:hypothetical protein
LLTLRSTLRLESLGLKRSGRSAKSFAKKLLAVKTNDAEALIAGVTEYAQRRFPEANVKPCFGADVTLAFLNGGELPNPHSMRVGNPASAIRRAQRAAQLATKQ